jgi:hypothetical protein
VVTSAAWGSSYKTSKPSKTCARVSAWLLDIEPPGSIRAWSMPLWFGKGCRRTRDHRSGHAPFSEWGRRRPAGAHRCKSRSASGVSDRRQGRLRRLPGPGRHGRAVGPNRSDAGLAFDERSGRLRRAGRPSSRPHRAAGCAPVASRLRRIPAFGADEGESRRDARMAHGGGDCALGAVQGRQDSNLQPPVLEGGARRAVRLPMRLLGHARCAPAGSGRLRRAKVWAKVRAGESTGFFARSLLACARSGKAPGCSLSPCSLSPSPRACLVAFTEGGFSRDAGWERHLRTRPLALLKIR